MIFAAAVFQGCFLKPQQKACGKNLARLLQIIRNLKETFSAFRNSKCNGNRSLLMGGNIQKLLVCNHALFHHNTIAGHFIPKRQVVLQIHKIHIVMNDQLLPGVLSPAQGNHSGRPVHILKFLKPGMRPAIRIHQSVHTEIAVVRILLMIAAVSVHFLSGNSPAHLNGMIAPFPDKAPAGALILLNHLKIILQVARAVSHGMAVLAHHIGQISVLLKIFMDFLKGRVHTAVHIQITVITILSGSIAGSLIMQKTCGVKLFGPFQRRLKGASIGALISHGPDHHTGTVFVPLHTPLCPVHRGLSKRRIVRNGVSPVNGPRLPHLLGGVNISGSVAFIIRLIDHIKAQAVIELVGPGRIGVMAGADSVDVVLLHHLKILHKLHRTDGKASDRVTVVAVCSMEFHLHTIYVKHSILCMNFPESHLVRNHLILRLQHQCV